MHIVAALGEHLGEPLELEERALSAVDRRKVEVLGLRARQVAGPVVVPAAARVSGRDRLERRLFCATALVGERAAIRVDAARDLCAQAREEPGDRVEPAVILADATAWNTAKEPDRVRVPRILQHLLDGSFLHQSARIEHADAIAHLRDHAEVVADEEHCGVELGLQLCDEVENLCLDGRIEPGRGLVEDQECGVFRQCHRDHDALLHAARQLVWVSAQNAFRIGDLYAHESSPGTLLRLARRDAEHGERLRDLRAHLE